MGGFIRPILMGLILIAVIIFVRRLLGLSKNLTSQNSRDAERDAKGKRKKPDLDKDDIIDAKFKDL